MTAWTHPEKLELQTKGGRTEEEEEEGEMVVKETDDEGFQFLCYIWNRGQSKIYNLLCALHV